MPGQAPSEGTKVTMGNQAPVTQEGSGAVSDSLATESQAFQSSNRVTEGASQQANTTSSGGAPAKSAGTAPGYIGNINNQDASGPHGKNLKEDPHLQGENNSAEFGTENDPGRLAEKKFALGASTAPVATGGREEHVDKKAPYDALSSEKEA